MHLRKVDLPAPLTIVIPTWNAAQELPNTLQCLIEGASTGLIGALVVSDGGSSDATLAIAEAAGAEIVSGEAGRGGQLRRGAEAAPGPWLLFLHADTHLSPGWAAVVADHIRDSGKAGVFRLRFRSRGAFPAMVAGWANLRSRLGLPYGDQGLLISRQTYDQIGGYPDIPLMEDVAMARRLRGQIVILPGYASTSAARYERDGWLCRGGRNLWILTRYLMGAPPEKLHRKYH